MKKKFISSALVALLVLGFCQPVHASSDIKLSATASGTMYKSYTIPDWLVYALKVASGFMVSIPSSIKVPVPIDGKITVHLVDASSNELQGAQWDVSSSKSFSHTFENASTESSYGIKYSYKYPDFTITDLAVTVLLPIIKSISGGLITNVSGIGTSTVTATTSKISRISSKNTLETLNLKVTFSGALSSTTISGSYK